MVAPVGGLTREKVGAGTPVADATKVNGLPTRSFAPVREMQRVWRGGLAAPLPEGLARLKAWLEKSPGEFLRKMEEMEEAVRVAAEEKVLKAAEPAGEVPIVDAGTGRAMALLENWLAANRDED